MFDKLKKSCCDAIPFSSDELSLVDKYFQRKIIPKKKYLLQENTVCQFISFIDQGCLRHFHVKNGVEKTCDISFENTWVTDFHSFTNNKPGIMNLQALEETVVFVITREDLGRLYHECPNYETFGRIMAERVAHRATEIAMSLSADKPEERFKKIITSRPDLFQNVPQKYIANFLGISPESLSRIRNRIFHKQKS